MKTIPSLRALLLLVLTLLLAGNLPAGIVHAEVTGFSVAPEQGTVGTTFTFTVTTTSTVTSDGWAPGEKIEYWVFGAGAVEPFEEGHFFNQPDEEGRTVWTWTAPEGVWAGTWTMNARGYDSYVAVQIPFEININTTRVEPISGVNPAQGTIGTTFNFFTDGWPKGDPVDYWVLPPGQDDPFALGKIYGDPDEQGRTSWKWTVPADAWAGTWTMNARGYYSEIFVQIPFVIEGPPPPAAPHISVEPAAGVPGETLTFTASGYRPEEEISFWISAPYQDTPVYSSIRKHAASGNGWITIPWTIPETAVTGRWRLVMFGDKSELEQFIDFDVIEPGAPEPVTNYVEPSTGPAGTTFLFYAAGFKPGELLEYWLTSPEGETVSDNIPVYANNQGGVVLQWASPADTVGGQWMITIQGARHLHEVILEFVVQGPQATPAPTEYATPPAGKPGTTFTFFAEGFESGAVVGWWATSPTGEVLQGGIDVTANRQGELRWSWTAPDNAMPGAWMMTAESKESLFQKTIWFEILPPDVAPTPTPAPSGVTPSAGPPGTTFTFETSELMPGENVGYWVTAPDRSIYPSPNNGEYNPNADEQGRLVLQWTAPEDAMPGEWMMVIQSAPTDQVNVEANSLVTIPFYIGY